MRKKIDLLHLYLIPFCAAGLLFASHQASAQGCSQASKQAAAQCTTGPSSGAPANQAGGQQMTGVQGANLSSLCQQTASAQMAKCQQAIQQCQKCAQTGPIGDRNAGLCSQATKEPMALLSAQLAHCGGTESGSKDVAKEAGGSSGMEALGPLLGAMAGMAGQQGGSTDTPQPQSYQPLIPPPPSTVDTLPPPAPLPNVGEGAPPLSLTDPGRALSTYTASGCGNPDKVYSPACFDVMNETCLNNRQALGCDQFCKSKPQAEGCRSNIELSHSTDGDDGYAAAAVAAAGGGGSSGGLSDGGDAGGATNTGIKKEKPQDRYSVSEGDVQAGGGGGGSSAAPYEPYQPMSYGGLGKEGSKKSDPHRELASTPPPDITSSGGASQWEKVSAVYKRKCKHGVLFDCTSR